MKYYLIPAVMAEKLNIKKFRKGNDTRGYLATSGDLAVIGIDNALSEGATEITPAEAKKIFK